MTEKWDCEYETDEFLKELQETMEQFTRFGTYENRLLRKNQMKNEESDEEEEEIDEEMKELYEKIQQSKQKEKKKRIKKNVKKIKKKTRRSEENEEIISSTPSINSDNKQIKSRTTRSGRYYGK